MSEKAFSHFDRVLSPVILFTRDLGLLYANNVAVRAYPWLTSAGLRLFCTEPSLCAARERVSLGHTVVLPVENDANCELVLQPVRDANGGVEYVFGFVHASSVAPEDLILMTDEPLMRMIRKEVSEPILEFLTLLDGEPFRSVDPKFGRLLASARKRLLRAGSFLVRSDLASLRGEESFRICEAGAVLALCAKCFAPMKFSGETRLYLPLGRDALIHIVTDVLTFLSAYRADGASITVSLVSREQENEIRFVASDWLWSSDTPLGGPSADLPVLQHRLSSVGGRIELEPGKNGHFRLSLIFPRVRLSLSDVVVGDYESRPSQTSLLFLEFLRDISSPDDSKE